RRKSRPSRRGPGRHVGEPAAVRLDPARRTFIGRRALQATSRADVRVRTARRRLRASWLLAVLAAWGCAEEEKTAPSVSEPPVLQVIHPQLRKIVRVVGQPSFVQSYERTSIYPKLTAFIEKWNVDIGDKVQKGDVLADLFVPELREDYGTKKATVQ